MKSDFIPYSIYVGNRPFRIAFLVNPAVDQAWADRIFKYNREKWGGRFNPIIFTDGNTFEDYWFKFLRDYDPDIIYSTVNLSADLLKKIQTFCSPLRVESIRQDDQYIHLDDDPVSVLPTGKNVARVSRAILDDKSSLVIFEPDQSTPEAVRLFLDRNFGLLETGQWMPYHLKKSLETCQTKIYKITDLNSLNEALLDLGDFHNRVVFPSQICSLPNSFKDVEYNYSNERFAVIVGDSFSELAYLWNRTLAIGRWMRTGITQLWVSSELANSQEIKPGLAKFINRCAGQTGNNNQHGVHFVTFSLADGEIETLANTFNGTIWHPKTSAKLSQVPASNFGQKYPFFFLRRGLELHRAHSNEEHLLLAEPDIEEGVMGGQYWFVDLFIQFRPERFTNIIGKDYWWQLPKRNSIIYDLKIFNKPARINEHGAFSAMMRRQSGMDIGPEEEPLVIKLPDDRSIFHALICGESFDCYQNDGRTRFLSRPFYTMQRSDKGMYLSGVLGLFPDLLNAHHFFEERYWRKMFETMANQSDVKDLKKKTEIINKLKKSIDAGRDFKESEDDLSWLAEKVLVFSKSFSKQEVDVDFKGFVEAAKKETDEYNQNPSGAQISFDEKEFKQEVSELVELGVLLLGIRPKCPRCGYRIWYHLDEVKQGVICKGCGYQFTLQAEERWYYRLNSLIRAAVSLHGTIPLLLALGQLMFDARSSFIFFPSLDLFTKQEKDNGQAEEYNHWGEIDLACIKDGDFVIGEIKQSVGLFDANDFEKMANLAKLIRPDSIIFTSMDKKPSKFVEDNIKKLKAELADLEINVEWYPLHYWIFDAHPVR